jgi:nucleotide-binding universal stress UspA family protein
MTPIRKILVPIDFSETSSRALDDAIELARVLGASVSAVHVFQIPAYAFLDATVVAPPELAAQLSDTAQKSLDAAVGARRGRGVEIGGILAEGIAWEEINRLSKELPAELVVVGTHGRRGLPRALLGSVAEKIVRTCPVPVLVVHGPRT